MVGCWKAESNSKTMATNQQYVLGENAENTNIGSNADGRGKTTKCSKYWSDHRNFNETETSKAQRVEESPSTPVVLDWERVTRRGDDDDDDDVEDDDNDSEDCVDLKTSSAAETEGTHNPTSKLPSSSSPEMIKLQDVSSGRQSYATRRDDCKILDSNRRFTDAILALQSSEDFVEREDTNSSRSMRTNANDEVETSNHGHAVGIGNNGVIVSTNPYHGDGAINLGAPNGRRGRDGGCLPCRMT